MPFRSLHDFTAFLEKQRDLARITASVSPVLEIPEITDRICKGHGPNRALLFENVEGSTVPLLINTFGSEQRTRWALGVDSLDELGERVSRLLAMDVPHSLMDKLRKLAEVSEVARFGPRMAGDGPCQEVVETEHPSLDAIPILQCWPEDGGRYITLPLVFTRDPVTGRRNVGMYRLQLYDDRTLGMHWHIHKGGAEHYRHMREAAPDGRLPVAIALGADPATIYAGSCPLPPIVDEMIFAGWLRRESVSMVRCRTVPLEVPAEADIVLEGYVDVHELRTEGPFGDHTGFYSLQDEYPVFHLTALTRRRDPIYPSIIVGRPPMEDGWLGKATERMFLPIIRMLHPEIVDIDIPPEGVFHNLVIVSIKKAYPGQARKVMYGLWSMGLMMLTKNIVVVDAGVDVHDPREVVWRVTNNIDPRRDVVLVDGPLDALDFASPTPHYGSKMGIDGTRKGPLDGHTRPWPEEVTMTPEIKALVTRRWSDYGVDIGG